MEALKVLGWAAWLIIAVVAVFETVGIRRLVQMFPEGYRHWMPLAQFAALAFFAAAVICNPWA